MKHHGILLKDDLAQAAHEGRKTQTRRPVTARNSQVNDSPASKAALAAALQPHVQAHNVYKDPTLCAFDHGVISPRVQVDDLLWVREAWGVGCRPDPLSGWREGIEFRADMALMDDGRDDLPLYHFEPPPEPRYENFSFDDIRHGWHPSIHMPKWACRTWLRVTGVRVERAEDISERDVLAEGLDCENAHGIGWVWAGVPGRGYVRAREGFAWLWEGIYGKGSASDWCWAYTFERCEAPEGL